MNNKKIVLFIVMLCCLNPQAYANSLSSHTISGGFVGSGECKTCHTDQYQQWQQSDHHKAMQHATEDTVLGDFADITRIFHNISNRLYKENGRYLIDTVGEDEKTHTFEIKYTFGFYPLQQYLVETKDGHIQALNVAWDSREVSEGGQRWFHLRTEDDLSTESPFYWTKHFQNWNSRCADCHSTNVDRNYNANSHSYQTTFSEVNVACEACHGPAKKHLELAKSNQLSKTKHGFRATPSQPLKWQFKAGDAIASPQGTMHADDINMCGDCHSLRSQLVKKAEGKDFHDTSLLRLVTEDIYFADGQIQEEAFVMGSFLQSKMYEKGVTCSNCHSPHTGKVLIEGNGLCSQCHSPQVFDTPKHHRHANNSEGAACVDCHMPARTYMQVDDRRDHSFTIPRPTLSKQLNVPNACESCHADKLAADDQWAIQQFKQWGVEEPGHWAVLNHQAYIGDPLVTRALTDEVKKGQLPALIRASLLSQLAATPSRVSVETAQQSLKDPSPLVRRAAVESMQNAPPQIRWQTLSPYLNDSSRSVRFQLADTLADLLGQIPANQRPNLAEIIGEYRQSLAVSNDSPASQMALANLEMRLGNTKMAEKHLKHALRIEPDYVPALANLADYYRGIGEEEKGNELLRKAIAVAPDSGAAQHSYALSLIRKGDYKQALVHLKLATEQIDATPRYAYVYAVALDSQGQLKEAITSLVNATERWPNQYDLLMTLVLYYDKAGNKEAGYLYLSRLSAIAPNSPDVKELIQQLK